MQGVPRALPSHELELLRRAVAIFQPRRPAHSARFHEGTGTVVEPLEQGFSTCRDSQQFAGWRRSWLFCFVGISCFLLSGMHTSVVSNFAPAIRKTPLGAQFWIAGRVRICAVFIFDVGVVCTRFCGDGLP